MLGGKDGGDSDREEKPSCGREGERGEGSDGETKDEEKELKMRKGEGGCEKSEFTIGFMRIFECLNSN